MEARRRFAPVPGPGWNMMFPAVSGNLKSCLKAVQSVLPDTGRAPVPCFDSCLSFQVHFVGRRRERQALAWQLMSQ